MDCLVLVSDNNLALLGVCVQVTAPPSPKPYTYDAACQGLDFYENHMVFDLDLAVAAVLPDEWVACSTACRLEWTREWIAAHLREAVRLQKPLLLVGVGAMRPQGWRGELMGAVQRQLEEAVQKGLPVAGETCHWVCEG
jgi:hypothetical protein